MKKILIALAAITALVAGASAAEATGRYNRHYGNHHYKNYSFKSQKNYSHGYYNRGYNNFRYNNFRHNNYVYRNPGYSNHGYYNYLSEPVYSYNEPECGYVRVKKVFWHDGYKYVKFVTKQVCDSYGY